MSSKKSISGDYQQERLKLIGWIVGFTDGEGCFTVSLHKNPTTVFGWQVMPEFVLTQGEKSLFALKIVMNYFNCGRLFINRRYDNHKEDIYRYCVKSQKELREVIIPFFKENKLKTSKNEDFERFSQVLNLMEERKHLTLKGINKILKIIEGMNSKKKRQLILKSSETTR